MENETDMKKLFGKQSNSIENCLRQVDGKENGEKKMMANNEDWCELETGSLFQFISLNLI